MLLLLVNLLDHTDRLDHIECVDFQLDMDMSSLPLPSSSLPPPQMDHPKLGH